MKKNRVLGLIILSQSEGQQPTFLAINFGFQVEFYKKKILKEVSCSDLI
jgi:hypothetical protein